MHAKLEMPNLLLMIRPSFLATKSTSTTVSSSRHEPTNSIKQHLIATFWIISTTKKLTKQDFRAYLAITNEIVP